MSLAFAKLKLPGTAEDYGLLNVSKGSFVNKEQSLQSQEITSGVCSIFIYFSNFRDFLHYLDSYSSEEISASTKALIIR
jgi:hypothetical protein